MCAVVLGLDVHVSECSLTSVGVEVGVCERMILALGKRGYVCNSILEYYYDCCMLSTMCNDLLHLSKIEFTPRTI